MDFTDNTTVIILAIISIFSVGIAITLKIRNNSKKADNRKDLKDVSAGGDIVFGNKKTKIKN